MKLHLTACLGVIVTVTGCSVLTAEDAAREFLPTYCEKLKECSPALFDLAYDDVDACIEKGVSAIPEGDRDRRSACSASEVETCRADLEEQTCEEVSAGASGLPKSCEGC